MVGVLSPEAAGSHTGDSNRRLTRTDSQPAPMRRRGPAVRRPLRHLAASRTLGPAAGGSAAGPEPPSLGKCCKQDELAPTEKENTTFNHNNGSLLRPMSALDL